MRTDSDAASAGRGPHAVEAALLLLFNNDLWAGVRLLKRQGDGATD